MNKIECLINERPVTIEGISPTTTLLSYLRDTLHLTGTKEGCNEGDCGACTVIMVDDDAPVREFRAIDACLFLVGMLHGKRIFTIEALNQITGKTHLIQDVIMRRYASQCGFCTPGVAMSMFEGMYRHDMRKPWQFVELMEGNLCRCTGYRPIALALQEVAGKGKDDAFTAILDKPRLNVGTLDYTFNGQRFYLPKTVEELVEFLAENPNASIDSGSSDVSVGINKRGFSPEVMVSLSAVAELRVCKEVGDVLHIGGATRLVDVERYCQDTYAPLGRILRFFASHQIKNVATVGGSVCGASPVGDLAPVLVGLGAQIVLLSKKGERKMLVDDFILGYRKTAIEPGEVAVRFEVPKLAKNARCIPYKVSKRQELDISSVSCCPYVAVDEAGIVTEIRLPFGGMAARAAARAKKAEEYLKGKLWSEENIEAGAQLIEEEFTPLTDARASAWYRKTVAANLLRGFYHESLEANSPAREYRPTATIQGLTR